MTETRRRLDSWKAIAAHLDRTVRTVQRWERTEGLPVHRLEHHAQGSVYAYVDELDAWWARRSTAPPPEAVDAHPRAAPVATLAPALNRRSWVRGGIALAVLAAVALAVVAVGRPRSSAADEAYAAGRQAWNRRTPDGFRAARAAFETALRADATHARAHSGLADTYSLLWAFGLMSRDEALPKARQHAITAVALGPETAEAHASLSMVLWEDADRAGAEAAARRAIALDPGYATARHWYAIYLQAMQRYDEAVVEGTAAATLNPDSPILATDLAIMLRNAGRPAEAERVLLDAQRRHPTFADVSIQLAMLHRAAGRDAEAAVLLRQGIELGDRRPRMIALLGCLELQAGAPARARETFERLRVRQPSEFFPSDVRVTLALDAGDLDAAFATAEEALAAGETWIGQLLVEPCYDRIRPDRRWTDLERRITAFVAAHPS